MASINPVSKPKHNSHVKQKTSKVKKKKKKIKDICKDTTSYGKTTSTQCSPPERPPLSLKD